MEVQGKDITGDLIVHNEAIYIDLDIVVEIGQQSRGYFPTHLSLHLNC